MSTQCCKRLQKEKEEMCASFEEAMTSLKGQHEEELAQLENRYWPRNQKLGSTHGSLSRVQMSPVFFFCVCQTEEFLPNRVGQSPPDIPGGGRQMLHDDGGAGQNISTHGYMCGFFFSVVCLRNVHLS